MRSPSKATKRASVRVRSRASRESAMSRPVQSTRSGAAAEVEHPPATVRPCALVAFDEAVGERLARVIGGDRVAEQLLELVSG
jgi:hypothetical protein